MDTQPRYRPSAWLLDARNWPVAVRAAHAGTEPAEVLPQRWRNLLWFVLVDQGLTDREIATLTRTSLYTTVRIRRALRLRANPPLPVDEVFDDAGPTDVRAKVRRRPLRSTERKLRGAA